MSQEKDSSLPPDVSNLTILALDHLIESSDPRYDYCPWWTNRDRSEDHSDSDEVTSQQNLVLDDDDKPRFVESIFNYIAEVCFKALKGSLKKFCTVEDVGREIVNNLFKPCSSMLKISDGDGVPVDNEYLDEDNIAFLLDWLVQSHRVKKYRCNSSQKDYYSVHRLAKDTGDQDDEMETVETSRKPANQTPNSPRMALPTEFATAAAGRNDVDGRQEAER